MDGLWARFLPEIRSRIVTLEAAAASTMVQTLGATERAAAASAAHKLAGVLGTFGLTRGTELARQMELAFADRCVPDAEAGAQFASMAAELRNMVDGRKPTA